MFISLIMNRQPKQLLWLSFSVIVQTILNYILLKEIYEQIQEETQRDEHKGLGMFVFIIMSQGITKDVLRDRVNQEINLQRIRDLLSSANFPAMRGKPKLMIVQADFMGEFMFSSSKDIRLVQDQTLHDVVTLCYQTPTWWVVIALWFYSFKAVVVDDRVSQVYVIHSKPLTQYEYVVSSVICWMSADQ